MRRILAAALFGALLGNAWALEENARQQADRYRALLREKPDHAVALERLWKLYLAAGETPVLLDLLRQEATQNEAARLVLARALGLAGNSEEARQVLQSALDRDPGNIALATQLGAILTAGKDTASLPTMWEKVSQAAPRNADALLRLGAAWQKAGRLDKARGAWEKAAMLAPDDLALRRKLADAARDSGDLEAATKHLHILATRSLPAEQLAAWEELVKLHERAGNWPQALSAQESLLALLSSDHWQLPAARKKLIKLHQRAGSLGALETKWSEEMNARPRDTDLLLRQAALQEFLGQAEQQRALLQKAVELEPQDATLAFRLAEMELAAGKIPEAAGLLDRVLELRPDDADAIFLRAEVDVLEQEEKQAEKRVEDLLAARKNEEGITIRAREFYRRLRLTAPLEKKLAEDFAAKPSDEAAVFELARFYLEEKQFERIDETFARFDAASLSPAEASAVYFRIAGFLRDARLPAAAEARARQALASDATNAEAALLLAEFLSAENRFDEMRVLLEQAVDAGGDTLPREDLDRRLFAALQEKKNNDSGDVPKLIPGQTVREMVEILRRRAESGGDASLLRLARWLRWSNRGSEAIMSIRNGLKNASNPAVLEEALAALLNESGRTDEAIESYEAIATINPERQAEMQKKIGQLELDRGNMDAGLLQFNTLAGARPRDWQALSDRALAEQVSGNWFRAFETWQQVYQLAPPDARRSLRQPILNAAVRLQLYDKALDLLETAAVTEREPKAREDVLREAAAFAVQNKSLDRWRGRLNARIQAEPNEASWQMGMVALLEAEGREEEARNLLVNISPEAESNPENLTRLLKAAEEAGDQPEAIRLARLATTRTTANLENWQKYAVLLENDGQSEEAARVWKTIAQRFARSAEALGAAALFFERQGNEEAMVSCLRASIKLGDATPQTYLRLGEMALTRGDRMQALQDFEDLLQRTRPHPEKYEDILPLPEWFVQQGSANTQLRRPDRTDIEGCRLLAIQKIGQMLSNSPRKAEWLNSWTGKDAFFIERIWALFASGDQATALAEMQQRISSHKVSPAFEEGFALLALAAGEGQLLAGWASDPEQESKRWDTVLAAFVRLIDGGWQGPSDEIARVFNEAPPLKKWQACTILAGRGRVRDALSLAKDVPATLPASQAVSALLRMAEWQLTLFDLDGAIRTLDQVIRQTPPATDFRKPLFTAVRMRWLLTPPHQRKDFEAAVKAHLQSSGDSGCSVAAQALFAALRRNNEEINAAAADYFQMLGTGESVNIVSYVQLVGDHLAGWRLPNLSRALYREALARGAALPVLNGESNSERAMVNQLVISKLANAQWEDPRYLVNEWIGWGASNEDLAFAAVHLQQMGRMDAAGVLNQILCERSMGNETVFTTLLRLAHFPAHRKFATEMFERLLDNPSAFSNQAFVQNMGQRLAVLLEENGEYLRALAILQRLSQADSSNRTLMLQKTNLLERLGRHREALKELETHYGTGGENPGYTLKLAELYQSFGRETEARALLRREERSPAVTKAEATMSFQALSKLPQGADEEGWQNYLRAVNAAPLSPDERFRVGEQVIFAQPLPPESIWREEFQKLGKIASAHSLLRARYFLLRKQIAMREGTMAELEKALRAEWDHGRGNAFAGEILIQMSLESSRFEEFDTLMEEYQRNSAVQEVALQEIALRLLASNQPERAARLFEQLLNRNPGDTMRAAKYAEALWKSGHREEAMAMIEPIQRIAALDPQKHLDVAGFFLNVHRLGLALPSLREASALLPKDGRASALWMQAAREAIAQQDFPTARHALEQAAAVPQMLQAEVLASYYQQSGQEFHETTEDFPLSPRQAGELGVLMASHALQAGQPERAWKWVESPRANLSDVRWRQILEGLEASDWKRAAQIWDRAMSENALWDARKAAAEFYLRRAAADESARIKHLQRAHELHPGSFSIAKAYMEEIQRKGGKNNAAKILQDVIDGYATAEDRQAAREMVNSLTSRPALPRRP